MKRIRERETRINFEKGWRRNRWWWEEKSTAHFDLDFEHPPHVPSSLPEVTSGKIELRIVRRKMRRDQALSFSFSTHNLKTERMKERMANHVWKSPSLSTGNRAVIIILIITKFKVFSEISEHFMRIQKRMNKLIQQLDKLFIQSIRLMSSLLFSSHIVLTDRSREFSKKIWD